MTTGHVSENALFLQANHSQQPYKLIAILRRQYRIILVVSWEKIYSKFVRLHILSLQIHMRY